MPTMPLTFRSPHQPSRQVSSTEYNARRGSARARGYSARWDKASKGYLARHVVCLACVAEGLDEAARVTDHIIPHRGDMKLFWDKENWQPCCRWHHDVVKQKLERAYQLGEIPKSDLKLTSRTALALASRLRVIA